MYGYPCSTGRDDRMITRIRNKDQSIKVSFGFRFPFLKAQTLASYTKIVSNWPCSSLFCDSIRVNYCACMEWYKYPNSPFKLQQLQSTQNDGTSRKTDSPNDPWLSDVLWVVAVGSVVYSFGESTYKRRIRRMDPTVLVRSKPSMSSQAKSILLALSAHYPIPCPFTH